VLLHAVWTGDADCLLGVPEKSLCCGDERPDPQSPLLNISMLEQVASADSEPLLASEEDRPPPLAVSPDLSEASKTEYLAVVATGPAA
jgi:hypothetical protein